MLNLLVVFEEVGHEVDCMFVHFQDAHYVDKIQDQSNWFDLAGILGVRMAEITRLDALIDFTSCIRRVNKSRTNKVFFILLSI